MLIDYLMWATLLATAILHLLQFLIIPWLTRRQIKTFIDGIDDEKLGRFVKTVSKLFVSKLATEEFQKQLQGRLMESARMVAMGQRSGDSKRLKQAREVMMRDLLKQSETGRFLALFPEFRKWVEERPENAETFIFNILPRLDAMRIKAKAVNQDQKSPAPSGIDSFVNLAAPHENINSQMVISDIAGAVMRPNG